MKGQGSEKSAAKPGSQTEIAGSPALNNRVDIEVGPVKIGGSFGVVVSVVLGLLLGAGGILALVYYYQQPDIVVRPMISTAAAATSLARSSETPSPTATPADMGAPTEIPDVFPLEQAPFTAFAYGGTLNTTDYKGIGILTVNRNGRSGTSYELEYRLPPPDEGPGYAGLSLTFEKPQDWTAYKFIEVTITLGDDQARCDIGIKDLATKANYVRLGDREWYGSDTSVTITGDTHQVTLPFKTRFEDVDLKFVKEIVFNIGSDFSDGDHSFTVDSLSLVP